MDMVLGIVNSALPEAERQLAPQGIRHVHTDIENFPGEFAFDWAGTSGETIRVLVPIATIQDMSGATFSAYLVREVLREVAAHRA